MRTGVFLTVCRMYEVQGGLVKQRRTYRPFLAMDVLLLLFIVATRITEAVGQRSLCGDSIRSLKEITVPIDGKTITSTYDKNNKEVNEEWIFRASDNRSFVNVEFLKYEFRGPTCNSSSQTGISKLRIKTDVDENWYCKGRRKPDNMTGQGFMQISYCQKFQGGEIVFRVKSSCSGVFLVKKTASRIQIPYNRKSSCVVQLVSTNKQMMIRARLEQVSIGTGKSDRCKGRYLSVTDEKGGSLLPGKADKLCNYATYRNYRDGMNVSVTSSIGSDRIIIKHRKAKFSLSFQLIDKAQVEQPILPVKTTARPYFSNATTNATTGGKLEDSAMSNTGTKGYGHIIGIGCGGIFILSCIILVLLFVRKKKKRRRQSRKSYNSKKDTNGNAAENHSPGVVSMGSISNAMYGQILDEQGDNTPTNGISLGIYGGDDDGLGRRNTRPQLPPPSECSAQEGKQKIRISNIYEKIEDMQTFRDLESRPMSCATFTSDEFSDDDGLTNDPYRCDYSVIINNSPQHTTKRNLDSKNTPNSSAHYDKMTPKISVHPTLTYDADTYINSNNDICLSKPYTKNEHEEGSVSLLSVDVMTRYASPRPSLPNLPRIALAEDAENYLSPRPSCPDVMINNGYSSTDDISEIRKRILAAAHPSLLGTSEVSSTSAPDTSHYHSPNVANAVRPSVYYSTPRRKETYCT